VRRPRLPRPSARRLGAALALVGLLAGLAFLVVPVEAALRDDPLLRLAPFSPALASGVAAVDCGVPVSNFTRRTGGLSLYDLARDHACRAAASRRAAIAVAAAAATGVLGLICLAEPGNRRLAAV
jgi:hypothetical protein